jgi:hypothetical protein
MTPGTHPGRLTPRTAHDAPLLGQTVVLIGGSSGIGAGDRPAHPGGDNLAVKGDLAD